MNLGDESHQDATDAADVHPSNLDPTADESDVSSARKSGRRQLWVIGATLAVVAAATAGIMVVVLDGSRSGLVEMHGKLLVVGGGTPLSLDNRGPCGEGGPYATTALSDVGLGAPITVYDDTGKIVGSATLGTGKSEPDFEGAPMGDCLTPFTVSKLPNRPFYQIEVARRGRVTIERKNLSDVGLEIGG